MGQVANIEGVRFGRLVPQAFAGLNKNRKATWLCRCDCGRDVTVISAHLRSGHTTSCGCVQTESRVKHGGAMAKTGAWKSWRAMMSRCEHARGAREPNYGAKGIRVCVRWRSFANFLADMGERPDRGTLDRIDNDRGYEPGNVRWATMAEQAGNRRNRRKLTAEDTIAIRGLHGVVSASALARRYGVSRATVRAIVVGKIWASA